MKVECPNCRMISGVRTDRLVTAQHAMELSCPNCDFQMALTLQSSLDRQNQIQHPPDHAGDQQPAPDSAQIDAAAQRSVAALKAKRIAETSKEEIVEDAFTAGLLHDAGKIILDPYVVKNKKKFKQLASLKGRPLFEAEKSILGFDHPEIMSRACRLWRFPEVQVNAIRYHHQPCCSDENKLACIIHLADVVAKTAGYPAGPSGDPDQIAPGILELLKLQKQGLDGIASAVAEDVQKIEEELQG